MYSFPTFFSLSNDIYKSKLFMKKVIIVGMGNIGYFYDYNLNKDNNMAGKNQMQNEY